MASLSTIGTTTLPAGLADMASPSTWMVNQLVDPTLNRDEKVTSSSLIANMPDLKRILAQQGPAALNTIYQLARQRAQTFDVEFDMKWDGFVSEHFS